MPQKPSPSDHESTKLQSSPTLHPNCTIIDSQIGDWTELGINTHMVESTFGDYSYTAGNVMIAYCDIGKFCSIAANVRINPGNHPMDRVSQHHFTYRRSQYGFGEDDLDFFNWRRDHRCRIGHDVWIGHGAIVMPGVSIGNGAVIGAGAVVTKNVEPYTIVVGVSAKPIRKRFPESIIAQLESIAWWDWEHEMIKARLDDLLDVEKFIERYKM